MLYGQERLLVLHSGAEYHNSEDCSCEDPVGNQYQSKETAHVVMDRHVPYSLMTLRRHHNDATFR